jgi:hypothetical protein
MNFLLNRIGTYTSSKTQDHVDTIIAKYRLREPFVEDGI